MTRAMAGTGWVALVCSMAYGQAPADGKSSDARLEFEVATVKPTAPQGPGRMMMGMRGGPGSGDPGRITYDNLSLRDLMTIAYSVKRSQITGEPSWLDSERFDITAKVPPGATKDEARVMLQNLLADRFKLTLHREKKEMSMYALVVGKNGPKLKESAAAPDGEPKDNGEPPPPPPPPMGGRDRMAMGKDGCPEPPPQMGNRPMNIMMFTNGAACMVATSQTMSGLADMLSNQFDRPVTDMTGLQGKYDFHLRFDPSSLGSGRGGMMIMAGPPPGAMGAGGGPGPAGGGGQVAGGGPGRDEAGGRGPVTMAEPLETPPTIFAALQEQLGLKLEPRKGPADLLVIDHIEKTPTEN